MKQALTVVVIAAVALTLMLPAVIFVSIVWTHRPDLSVMNIVLLIIREIGDIIIMKTGGCSGGKENGDYENHHL